MAGIFSDGESYLAGRNGGQKYDLLKFVLSLFIVGVHTDLFPYYFRPAFRIAVPLFFIMSAYFFFLKIKGKDNIYGLHCLLRFVKRNMLLYVFWFFALSWFFFDRFFGDGLLHGCARVSMWFCLGSTFPASWYISASIIALIGIWILSRFMPDWGIVLLSLLLYLFASWNSTYSFISGTNCGFAPQRSFVVGFLWMSIGKCFAGSSPKFSDGMRACLFAFVVIMFGVLYVENWLIPYDGNLQSDCYLSLILLCPAIFALISQYDFKVYGHKSLRKLSTMIYCQNLAVGMTILYKCEGLAFSPVWSLTTLAICLIVAFLILKLEKVRFFGWLKYAH